MKNSKLYAQKMQKLYRKLKRERPKVQPVTYEEPLDAVVYAQVAEHLRQSDAQAAVKRCYDHFIDLNDMRVSRTEEIMEVLGKDVAAIREAAGRLVRVLASVFNQYNAMTLGSLQKGGKRPAKQALEKLDGMSPFVVDYCMLTALQGHAIPLTARMVDCLKADELVDPDADEQQIEGFLTRQIAAKNAYEFYELLRWHSETGRPSKRKAKTKKTTKKKAKTVKKATKTRKAHKKAK